MAIWIDRSSAESHRSLCFLATLTQLLENSGGTAQPRRFKEGQAADRLGGVDWFAHQLAQALIGAFQLLSEHSDDALETFPQDRICQIGPGFFEVFYPEVDCRC